MSLGIYPVLETKLKGTKFEALDRFIFPLDKLLHFGRLKTGAEYLQDLLAEAGELLIEGAKFRLRGFLQDYSPPEPAIDDD